MDFFGCFCLCYPRVDLSQGGLAGGEDSGFHGAESRYFGNVVC